MFEEFTLSAVLVADAAHANTFEAAERRSRSNRLSAVDRRVRIAHPGRWLLLPRAAKSTFAAALLMAAWQLSPSQASLASAQTATAQPPQADTQQRHSSRRTDSTAIIPDPKVETLATATRTLTDQGLFAEEYDAILEVAQGDPQLFAKIIERIIELAK